jgi:hypothetical protein
MAPVMNAWLHSSDPRTQAWSAYLALRARHTEAIPVLLEFLAKYSMTGETFWPAGSDRHDAMLETLDAFIQLERGYL